MVRRPDNYETLVQSHGMAAAGDNVGARAARYGCHCAGIVISGRGSFSPVSASVNNIIMNANVRLVLRSRSSIQNQ